MRSMRSHVSIALIGALALAACKDSKGAATNGSAGSGSAVAVPTKPPEPPAKKEIEPIETTRDKMIQDKLDRKGEKDAAKGDKNDTEWVPAEFKSGMARWKDTGVYLDGKPIAFLTFGELPIALKPTWIKDKVSAEMRPNSNDPGWRWALQRSYKFTDYLKALGVDIRKVKEIHVYGPKFSETIIATGKDLQSPKSDVFRFRFGGNTFGKALPMTTKEFGNGKSPDKIASVMIYITKKPPTLIYNEGLELDGVPQLGVPYYGEPIRGGIRVYVDDKLATIIKRQDLDVAKATKAADGELHWNLYDVLTAQGADLSKVKELWTVREELRQDAPVSVDDLKKVTFTATSQAKGGIMLFVDDRKLRTTSIAFHTRNLAKDELPIVTPDDE